MSLRRYRGPARGRAATVAAAAALAAGALAMSACTGSLFKSREPPQSVYLLAIVPAAAASAAQIPGDLTILRPRVRAGLDTALIAALYPDRRLEHFAAARWSAPLDQVLEDLALQAFRADAQVQNVHADVSAFGTGHWLEIDVEDFQAEYGGPASAAGSAPPTIHVRLVARLGASGDQRVVGQFEADVREPAADNRLTAIVDAYNRGASAALAKLVEETGQALSRQ